jgi:hypothetical protein
MHRSKLLAPVAVVITTAGLLLAAPAQAVSATTVVSQRSSLVGSETTKTVRVACPSGQFVYGPGAAISSGAGGNVTLQKVVALGSPPDLVEVTATEVNGSFGGSWNVTAYAICGPLTPNLQVVSSSAVGPSTASPKEANVSCPTGLRLYGTSFEIVGGNGNALVHDVLVGIPSSPRSLTVRATARPGAAPSWSLRAIAICANPATTNRVVQLQTALDSSASKSVNHVCPAGTIPHGVGAQTLGDPGTAVDGRVTIRTMAALATTVASVNANELGSLLENWRAQVYVICAN